MLEAWPGLSPALRAGAVEAFLSRPAWITLFLDAVEQGKINRGDVDPARIQALQTHLDAPLRARAARLFAATKLARRQDVVTAYRKVLQLKGDRVRGKAVFAKVCSGCHRLEGVGSQVGAVHPATGEPGRESRLGPFPDGRERPLPRLGDGPGAPGLLPLSDGHGPPVTPVG